jgi:hypothetical protein
VSSPLLPARIEGLKCFIGDTELPNWIADGGIVFTPGDKREVNRLTVTFLVGEFTADDTLGTAGA